MKCLLSGTCECFEALTLVDASCTKFESLDNLTRNTWSNCIDPEQPGSFTFCRKQEREVARIMIKCGGFTPITTTKRVEFQT